MSEYIYIEPVEVQLARIRAEKAAKKRAYRTVHGRKPRSDASKLTNATEQRERERRRAEYRRECIAILDMETDPFDNTTGAKIMPFLAVLYRDGAEPVVIWEDMPDYEVAKFRKRKPGGQTNAQWEYRLKKEAEVEARNRELDKQTLKAFARKVRLAIEALPDEYTIYAHNGGKFDFMFLMPELRGAVSFKGRSLMSARIGPHELRDSLHILPVSLERANRKDAINYDWMRRDLRDKHRQQIIDYCIADCRYTLEVVKVFIAEHGRKLSIGQAAMSALRSSYDNVYRIHEHIDGLLRPFYHGGRVECLEGAGWFGHNAALSSCDTSVSRSQSDKHCSRIPTGDLHLYDINSAYPAAMAFTAHPIGGGEHYYFRRAKPEINGNTFFLKIRCRNDGALLAIDEDGTLTSRVRHGEFHTTIHEFRIATQLGLISDVELLETVDCSLQSNFSDFVLPRYAERQRYSELIDSGTLAPGSDELIQAKMQYLFIKLILNNAYGKFAQDPRRFKETYITDPGEQPPRDERDAEDRARDDRCRALGITERGPSGMTSNGNLIGVPNRRGWGTVPVAGSTEDYWLWERPSLEGQGFYNVGTAASITGAVRAMIINAIAHAKNPLYCDTDSLLCEGLDGVELHNSELGAWKLEGSFREAYIAGKKSYALIPIDADAKPKVRHKGGTLTVDQMKSIVLNGIAIETVNFAPTISRDGSQAYIRRTAQVTARKAA